MSKKDIKHHVAYVRREVFLGAVAFWVIGLIVINVATAMIGLPWFVGVIVSVFFSFLTLWLEGEAEDEVLVEAYGEWKKEDLT